MAKTVHVPRDLVGAAKLRSTLNRRRGVVSSKVTTKLAAAKPRHRSAVTGRYVTRAAAARKR